jgi:hypothetical protein
MAFSSKQKYILLKKLCSAFCDIIQYTWTKFEQNRIFSRGREISDLFDGY